MVPLTLGRNVVFRVEIFEQKNLIFRLLAHVIPFHTFLVCRIHGSAIVLSAHMVTLDQVLILDGSSIANSQGPLLDGSVQRFPDAVFRLIQMYLEVVQYPRLT
jgi:hypothetical protein